MRKDIQAFDMSAKTNLKGDGVSHKKIGEIAGHLYFAKSALQVLSCLDTSQPDALEDGSVQGLALEVKIRVEEALKILNP